MDKKNVIATCVAIIETLIDSSDSSSEEEYLEVAFPKIHRPRIKNYLTIVSEYSNKDFKSHFRLSRNVFNYLVNLIAPKLKRQSDRYGRFTIHPEMQVLIAIWTFATPDSYRSVCDRFNVGRATAWLIVRKVCRALYALAPQFIKWPNEEEAECTWRYIENKYKFPKVIGAIDGTHINIAKPKEHSESYIDRKGHYSIQLQIICDSTLKFMHCYAGQPGCVHDMRVFRLSGIQELCTENYFPQDSHIIGDAAYSLQKHVMVPYKNNGHLTEAQMTYNYRLSSARMIIERAIGLLKGRFRSLLDKLHMKRTDLIPRYIIACCVLHNICLLRGDFIEDLIIINREIDDNVPNNELNNEHRERGIEKRMMITNLLSNRQ